LDIHIFIGEIMKYKLFTLLFVCIYCSGFAQSDTTAPVNKQSFNFNHTLPKLFAVQTARVLNSMDFSLLLGGAFGFEGDNGFLGTVSFGLGGYGDLEMSTSTLMASIFTRDENYGNISLKGQIYKTDDDVFTVSLGLRSNSTWESSSASGDDIRTASETLFEEGLRHVQYSWRMTSLFLSTTYAKYPKVNLHAGIALSDLRYKDAFVEYNGGGFFNATLVTKKKNILNFFIGADKILNERTMLVAEALSTPVISVKPEDGSLFTERRYSATIGLRFFVNRWFILDSALRYQDDYSGLADTQIRIGLQGIWNVAGY